MAKNWAIAIGINNYFNLQPLNYAKRDAETMRDWCQKEAGFDRVFLFTEDSPEIPASPSPIPTELTYGNLRRFLRVNFEKPLLHSGDNLWFFFAGHGCREADQDYLMLIDTDPGDVEHTAIPVDFITQKLRRSGADNVVLFLDACRDQGDKGGLGIGAEHQGVVTFYSCSPNEKAYEIEALEQGSFTHCLLEALRIQGEGNCATVERLYQHLRYQVPQLNTRYKKPRQTPYTIAEPATKLHLILLPKQATLTDVTTLKNDAYKAEAENNLELAEQFWIRVLVVSPGDQQAIRAIKRIAQRLLHSPAPPTSEPVTNPSLDIATPSIQVFEFEVVSVDDRGREVRRDKRQAECFSEDLGNGVTLEMVLIPAGFFQMGSPLGEEGWNEQERPQHTVNMPNFFLGKFEVTQEQYQRVMRENPSGFKGAKRPVEQVSWNDAVEFCKKLSQKTGRTYRLPSEAEWEYAARAGTTTPFHFGETITTELANYNGDYTYASAPQGKNRGQTTEVGSFPPNAFGLYDMHGNVWEWCQDTWHDSYEGAPRDGSAWVDNYNIFYRQLYILRGGSWNYAPGFCRSAFRGTLNSGDKFNPYGFRVVCGVTAPIT
ncbi:hypothetical protein NIES4073_64280 [Kalymmatonema gypsitolerans NIES-4073]|nr:hypothetical protein NIES4073_64280 [Scytonema sp. NIES-4073]